MSTSFRIIAFLATAFVATCSPEPESIPTYRVSEVLHKLERLDGTTAYITGVVARSAESVSIG
ncbi:MAG: hypothetical protein ACM3PW_10840, partial [Chlamydiota bacterium]